MAAVLSHSAALPSAVAKNLKIVYTPFNGAGNLPVRRALAEAGFTEVYVPEAQEMPDPNFTTIGYPNPESPEAFAHAIIAMVDIDADIVIATDPDCDRVGVVIRKNDQFLYFSGNQIGVLLTEYIIRSMAEKGTLPTNASVTTTIVSTDMTKAVCKHYGVACYEVLTGFKYIAEKIREFLASGEHTPLLGFEESIGYLIGTHSRDKDGVTATLLVCEMAAVYKQRGMDLYDGLMELYDKYGYYLESTINITMPGLDGLKKIRDTMARLRGNPPQAVNGVEIVEFRDYSIGITTTKGGTAPTGLPLSDVLYYVLKDGSWFCVRPSGTEPKVKIYMGVKETTFVPANEALQRLVEGVKHMMEA